MLSYIFSLSTVWWLILLIYVPSCIGLIVVVLLQKGKGVGFAGAFGAGTGAETIFGPRSSRSLPQRITYTMAGLFMFLALVMSTLSGQLYKGAAPSLPAAGTDAAATGAGMEELFEGGEAGDTKTLDPTAPGDEGPVKLPLMYQDPPEGGAITSGDAPAGEAAAPAAPETPGADETSTGGSPQAPAAEAGTSGHVPAETPESVEGAPAPALVDPAPAADAATAPAADAAATVDPAAIEVPAGDATTVPAAQ
jgi:protein translocase SecG subunit